MQTGGGHGAAATPHGPPRGPQGGFKRQSNAANGRDMAPATRSHAPVNILFRGFSLQGRGPQGGGPQGLGGAHTGGGQGIGAAHIGGGHGIGGAQTGGGHGIGGAHIGGMHCGVRQGGPPADTCVTGSATRMQIAMAAPIKTLLFLGLIILPLSTNSPRAENGLPKKIKLLEKLTIPNA